eukprot:2149956-Amphidinium_carterae.1
MIEIACMREQFATAQAVLEFRRCLVQALDIKSSQLLQVPHISEGELQIEEMKQFSPPIITLVDLLALDTARRRDLLHFLNPDQMADVDAFCSHVGEVELTAKLEVEDEKEIVVSDVATVLSLIAGCYVCTLFDTPCYWVPELLHKMLGEEEHVLSQ